MGSDERGELLAIIMGQYFAALYRWEKELKVGETYCSD